MVEDLRKRQEDTMLQLDKAIEELKGDVDEAKLASLQKLRRDMAARLED
jgi:translation elongation factor EF-Ts